MQIGALEFTQEQAIILAGVALALIGYVLLLLVVFVLIAAVRRLRTTLNALVWLHQNPETQHNPPPTQSTASPPPVGDTGVMPAKRATFGPTPESEAHFAELRRQRRDEKQSACRHACMREIPKVDDLPRRFECVDCGATVL